MQDKSFNGHGTVNGNPVYSLLFCSFNCLFSDIIPRPITCPILMPTMFLGQRNNFKINVGNRDFSGAL